jgi:hypothetical protein
VTNQRNVSRHIGLNKLGSIDRLLTTGWLPDKCAKNFQPWLLTEYEVAHFIVKRL